MFAIEITEENLPAILTHQETLIAEPEIYPEVYLGHPANWYYVRGWIDSHGEFVHWTIMPESSLKYGYEYDPNQIKTDWDQIVRK